MVAYLDSHEMYIDMFVLEPVTLISLQHCLDPVTLDPTLASKNQDMDVNRFSSSSCTGHMRSIVAAWPTMKALKCSLYGT